MYSMDIHAFWKAVLAQDARTLRSFFHPDAIVNWHCTNEQFSVSEYIVANCEYPGQWDGEIERIEQLGDLIITVTLVYPVDKSCSFHVTSFLKTYDGKIQTMDEYWADDGSPPQWRLDKHIGKPVKSRKDTIPSGCLQNELLA